MDTNNTVVWLYAVGLSFILPEMRFGMVSQDWLTIVKGSVSPFFYNKIYSVAFCVYQLYAPSSLGINQSRIKIPHYFSSR